MNEWGAKVPDGITAPSFVTHCTMRYQVTLATGGAASPCAGLFLVPGDLRAAGTQISCGLVGGATAGSLVQTAAAAQFPAKSYATAVIANANAWRVVSSAIYMSYQGSPLNAKGRVSVAFISPTTANITLPPVTLSDVQALPYLSTLPASVGFAQTRWMPIDPISKSYIMSPGPFVRGLNNGAGLQSTPGALLILVDGGTAGDIVEFTIVENLECLPAANASNLSSPTPSKSDPIELALVDNFIAANPNLPIMQNADETANKTAVTLSQQTVLAKEHDPVKHESGFLEKVMGGLVKVGNFAVKHGPQIAGLAATVAGLAL